VSGWAPKRRSLKAPPALKTLAQPVTLDDNYNMHRLRNGTPRE
jgi:hypothetical protein